MVVANMLLKLIYAIRFIVVVVAIFLPEGRFASSFALKMYDVHS